MCQCHTHLLNSHSLSHWSRFETTFALLVYIQHYRTPTKIVFHTPIFNSLANSDTQPPTLRITKKVLPSQRNLFIFEWFHPITALSVSIICYSTLHILRWYATNLTKNFHSLRRVNVGLWSRQDRIASIIIKRQVINIGMNSKEGYSREHENTVALDWRIIYPP